MELIKDYDLNIQYHPRKANVVADAFSRKASCGCTLVERNVDSLCQDMQRLNVSQKAKGSLSMLQVTSHLLRDIKGVASVRNVQVCDIDRGLAELFIEHLGRVRERLKHRGVPYVPTGLMGDIPCFELG